MRASSHSPRPRPADPDHGWIAFAHRPVPPAVLGWGHRARDWSEWRLVVEVAAAFGLPLPSFGAVALAAFGGAFDLGGGELQAGPNLVGLDLGHRPLLAFRGLPAALAQ